MTNNLQDTQLYSANNVAAAERDIPTMKADLHLLKQVFTAIEQQLQVAPVISSNAHWQGNFAQYIQSETEVEQFENLPSEDFELRRAALIKRDCEFAAADLRSFCTEVQPPLESAVYSALAGFYRNLAPTAAVLSKFDYVITQFFSRRLPNNHRALRLNAEEIVVEMRRLNFEWAGNNSEAAPNKSKIREAISNISSFSIQAKKHETLKSWLEDDFFSRSREMKRALSETFFVPEVTAAIVICNLVVGNHFASLCEAESAALEDAASIFATDENAQETITTHLNSSFQTLVHSGLEEDSAETAAQERIANLLSLVSDEKSRSEEFVAQPIPVNEILQVDKHLYEKSAAEISDEPLEPRALIVTASDDLSEGSNTIEFATEASTNLKIADKSEIHHRVVAETVQKAEETSEIEKVLKELSQPNPDKQAIKNYLKKSNYIEIRELSLDNFLDKNQEEGKYLTKVLKLVLSAEAAINLIESSESISVPKFQEEVRHLRDEIQIVNNRLRQLMSKSPSAAQGDDKLRRNYFETLLNITNISAKVQLRLNSAILRREKRQENSDAEIKSSTESETTFEKIEYNTVDSSDQKAAPTKNYNSSRILLIAATILVLLGGAVWFIFNSATAETIAVSADVKTVEPKSLRGGEVLIGAKINKQTLFGFVNKEWNAQSPEQKKENLKSLLDEGSKNGFEKVLLINQSGEMVGSATQTEVRVL